MLYLALFVLALASQTPSQQTGNPQQPPEATQYQSGTIRPTSLPEQYRADSRKPERHPTTDERQATAQERTAYGTDELVCWSRISALGTCAAALVVLVYTCYAKRQKDIMLDQVEHANRAWVSIRRIRSIDDPLEGFPSGCELLLFNSSNTPAKGMVSLFLKTRAPEVFPQWHNEPTHLKRAFFAGPRLPVKASIDFSVVDPHSRDEITSDQSRLWLMIRVDYTDTFDKPRWLWTSACLELKDDGSSLWHQGPSELTCFG